METRIALLALAFGLLFQTSSVVAQPIGEVDTAGTTYYDLQHIGTCGRMIGVDAEGFVQVVWMRMDGADARHAYYNVWDPQSGQFAFAPGGCQVDVSPRAGYVTLAVLPSGLAFPAYHETSSGSDTVAAGVAFDFLPRSCAFTFTRPASSSSVQHLWPIVAQTPDSVVHMVTTQGSVTGGDPRGIFYSRGKYDVSNMDPGIDWQPVGGDDDFLFIDSCMTASVDVAASRHSNRVALGWAHNRDNYHSQIDNDAMIKLSDDGGVTWGPNQNITNFVAINPACCDTASDPDECLLDTFRLYTDMSLLFDESDVLHAAFSARTWFDLSACGGDPYGWISQSGIWHWSEATGNFAQVASAFHFQTVGGELTDNGAWQLNVQRPSLAIDATTGYLYCSYMQYDSNCYSDQGYPMADVFISVSTDNGEHWSVGTNVTRTCPGENIPPPGSMSEREPTLAEVVTDGTLHVSYVLDNDAGAFIQNEGVATLNQFIYQRIPVDSIATTPLLPDIPIHADSTGFVPARDQVAHAIPKSIELQPAYPNPFNSSTVLRFESPAPAFVSLNVYDVLGRQVATIFAGSVSAGQHRVIWTPTVPSGVYFARLNAGSYSRTQKLLLLR